MESMESPLEVLSRAATMVQHCRTFSNSENGDDSENVNGNSSCGSNASASPPSSTETTSPGVDSSSAKQLTSSKWRRERRCTTRIPDYKNRELTLTGNNKALRSQSFNDKSLSKVRLEPICKTRNGDNNLHHSDSDLPNYDERNHSSDLDSPSKTSVSFSSTLKSMQSSKSECTETPLDMSVKMRSSPPSYSQSISNSHLYRPSVITQTSNNTTSNTVVAPIPNRIEAGKGEYIPGSMSMCDPVIDEHFRRSLGADYMTLFSKNKDKAANNAKNQKTVITKDRGSSPIMFPSDPCSKFIAPLKESKELELEKKDEDSEDDKMEVDESAGLTVDDHFAKALGETWKKLQKKTEISKDSDNTQKNSLFTSVDGKDISNSNHNMKLSRSVVI